jgi:hypothetical protein
MNNTEVTMHDSKFSNDLLAYTVALEAAADTLALVRRVPAPFKTLADQLSLPLSLSLSLSRKPLTSSQVSASWIEE